jgi:hypothetical protein
MSSTKLVDLARTVSHNVALLTAKLEAQNAPLPYFVPGTLHKYPEAKDIQEPRQALIELAMDLYHLALGSGEYIKQQAFLVRGYPSDFDLRS